MVLLYDQFGISVAISGDTVVVGANGEDSNATGVGGNQTDNSATDAGATYVFRLTYTVSATVGGLTGTGLKLQLNGAAEQTVSANGSLTFSTPLASGASYAVSVSQQPTGQRCTVTSGAGTIASADITNVTVACVNVYGLNAAVSPSGGGTVSCTPNPVSHGSDTSCTANPSPGYSFSAFTGDCTGSACTLNNVTSAKNVTATFTQNPTCGPAANTATPTAPNTNLCGIGTAGAVAATDPSSYNWQCANAPAAPINCAAARQYALSYNGNNSTGGSAPGVVSVTAGSTITTAAATTFTRTGYTFIGWNTAANGGGSDYIAGSTFTMPPNALTLYAQWTPDSQTLTYHGNSNTGGTAPAGGNPATGTTVTVAGNTGNLTRTGYTFGGWNTAANGSGTSYSAGSTFAMPPNAITLYAQWTAGNQTLSYNGNGNTGGTVPADATVATGATATVAGNTGNLTRTGYTFGGWNTAANGSGTSYAAGSTFAMPPNAITLYAQWSAENTYTVGGTVTGLTGRGLVLQNNGGSDLAITADGAFTFPLALASGSPYAVTVLTQPGSPTQACSVSSGRGTVGSTPITSVVVHCQANAYPIAVTSNLPEGGTITCNPDPVPVGESATCTATAKPGYRFIGFTGDCTGLTCTLKNVTSARSLSATFERAATKSFTGPTATGTGSATATVSGGGDACGFAGDARFVPLSHVATVPPTGYSFPHGLFKFTLSPCTPGATVTLTIRYPALLPEGTRYWKYGPTPDQAEHWYLMSQASINGDTVTFNLTDGGLGDQDLKANGTISDPSGPAVPVTDIPILSQWAMLALLMGLLALGGGRLSRKSIG